MPKSLSADSASNQPPPDPPKTLHTGAVFQSCCALHLLPDRKPERILGGTLSRFRSAAPGRYPMSAGTANTGSVRSADADLVKFTPIEKRQEELRLAGHSGAVPNRLREALRCPVLVVGPGHMLRVSMDRQGMITGTQTIPHAKFVFSRSPDADLMVSLRPENVAIDPSNVKARNGWPTGFAVSLKSRTRSPIKSTRRC
jgi:hypothetical protein